MKPARLPRTPRPRTLRRESLRRLLRQLRRGRGLRPLVSALVSALPLVALHPAAVAGSFPRGVVRAITPPAPLAVPTPAADWLQQGSATNNQAQAQTTGQMQVDQSSTRAIYRWSRFDIGARAGLTINTPSGGSSLNLVGSGDVSRIFGSLTSNGEVFLVNPSGIWFGRGASVNVAGLFASTLQLDAADYMAGLATSLRSAAPTFTWQDVKDAGGAVLQTFDHPDNFVHVDSGATITTPSGGRVFLLAREATNAGRIETPGGQTVLAAGREAYLQAPGTDTSPLYASESNDKVPATRGLLVEVGGGASGEVATNLGDILAARGNVTLVGLAVNQSGRISATTSVQENGSIFLLARSGASARNDNGSVFKQASVGGALTLGAGSRIDITPEASAATSTDSSAFTRSRIELSGQTIQMQDGAAIRAPGAIVNARAADVPVYDTAVSDLPLSATARIVLGANTTIDVSGTTDAQVSAARNYVATELIGQADLKDAPLQKLGPLYQKSGVVFDVRKDVPILGLKAGDTANPYVQATARTASERLASGGSITLESTGLVAAHATSLLDVSGGRVTYTGATVPAASVLVAADGRRYTLNDAPADLAYRTLEGYAAGSVDRFGVNAPAGANLQGRWDPGYVEGRAAGTVKVSAPVAWLDGQMRATTFTGSRQAAGLDPLAGLGTLVLGRTTSGPAASAVLGSLAVTAAPAGTDAGLWADLMSGTPATAVADATGQPLASRISAVQIRQGGFGKLDVAAEGDLVQQAGADLLLPQQAAVTLRSRLGNVALNASTVSRGGAVSVVAGYGSTAATGADAPAVSLAAGQRIDVAGDWVNRWRDGADARPAVKGGSIALRAGGALTLGAGSVLDVSGGATLSTNGSTVTGTAAGSITLESNNAAVTSQPLAPITLDGELRGYGWSAGQGGSLRVKAGEVVIDAGDGTPRSAGTTLALGDRFFEQGGFAAYDIEGVRTLTVQDGARITPRTSAWLARSGLRNVGSGVDMARIFATGRPLDGRLSPVRLTLQSKGPSASERVEGEGALRLAAGARIEADPGSSLTLLGGNSLVIEGDLRSAGGSITLGLAGRGSTSNEPFAGTLRVADGAEIDVSGTTVRSVDGDRYNQGQVLSGGTITLSTVTGDGANGSRTLIDIEDGAVLRADGSVGVLDVPRALGGSGPAMARDQLVASDGGRIIVNAREGGAYLGGTLQARAGQGRRADGTVVQGTGGSLAVGIGGSSRDGTVVGAVPEVAVVVQQAAPTRAQAAAGTVTVSADRLAAGGFADVQLASSDRIVLQGDIDFRAAGTLSLDAPVLTARQAAAAAQQVSLSAATALRMGSSTRIAASQPLADSAPTPGTARLDFSGGLMELFGDQVVQGAQQIRLAGARELRLRGVTLSDGQGGSSQSGSLRAAADVTFSAPQVVPTTATRYTVDLTGEDGSAQHLLRVTGGDAASAAPLSAAAVFTAKAADIELDGGVIRAPFGQVDLQATRSIGMSGDSLVSVSGSGLAVPYGGTQGGGTSWLYDGNVIDAPLAKSVTLSAPGHTVQVRAGTLDLSGGGQMLGWEFVPGPGGSTDIFTGQAGAYAVVPTVTGYAPHDAVIAATQGGTTLGGALPLGQQITVGAGGPLPAGTYALLPARYALLPGAFLVTPQGRTATALGYAQQRPDGSYLVGAVLGQVGSAANNRVATAWTVTPSAIARRSAEVRTTDADTYFAAQATRQGSAVPRLARDAGALNIEALSLALESVNRFQLPDSTGRGGSLNISSERIHVAGAGTPAVDGALNLSVDQLNATGIYSLMLGGRRGTAGAGGTEAQVTAREVTVDTGAGPALQAGDIVLAATDKVDVAAGARLSARAPSGTAETLAFSGDGALLRVSADADAASLRTGASGAGGDLSVGAGAVLTGGSVTVEATRDLQLHPSARLDADTVNVGARRIDLAPAAAGGPLQTGVQAGTTNLAAQLASARRIALRGFESITLAAGTQLGSDRLAGITLDTSALRAAAGAAVQAGGITLANTTGVAPADAAAGGQGALMLQADGRAGGDGHLRIQGAQVIDGVQQAQAQAAGSVVIGAGARLATGGDLLLTARTLTAAAGATPQVVDAGQSTERTLPQLQAGGLLSLARPGADAATAAVAEPGIGTHVVLAADRIEQRGTIDLPTARLELRAAGSAGGTAVRLAGETRDAQGNVVSPGSQTLLPGVVRRYDGQAVAAPAGQLILSAAQGDVVAEAGSVIDVSAAVAPASAGGGAGSVAISAPAGTVQLDGRLRATSGAGQTGGSLSVDSLRALDLAALATRLADERHAGEGVTNFGAALNLRNRSGDQAVAADTRLQAQQIALTADQGALTVAGTLQAGGSSSVNAGGVRLQAGGDVTLAAGAQVSANASASGQTGGTVFIGTQQGRLALQSGAVVESRGSDAADGTLKLRAPRTGSGAGSDVAVDALAADVSRVGRIEVEGFKSYDATTINASASAAQGTVSGGASGTVATVAQAESFLTHSAAIVSRLTAGLAADQRSKLSLRAGIDIASTGNLTLANPWNLTRFSASGALDRAGGQPINLTLRAAGDLLIQASLSDGFKAAGATTATAARAINPGGVIVGPQGSDLRLVGGADLSSADWRATRAGVDSGDVRIGRNGRATLVRTTTGDIDIAAGRDVVLDSRQAVVYSSGVPVAVDGFAGFRFNNEALSDGTLRQSPFLAGSGAVSISALRDVLGGVNGSTPYLTNWWWRTKDLSGQAVWYTRYDQFEQGFGSFGGGDVRVSAGRDAVQVQLAAPESGLLRSSDATRLGGGDVSLSADRQVIGGLLVAGGGEARVTAGSLVAQPSDDGSAGTGLQVLHGDTAVSLQASQGMVVGRVGEAGMVGAARQGTRTPSEVIDGLAAHASLSATVTAGDLTYLAARPTPIAGETTTDIAANDAARYLPQTTRLAALQGDLLVQDKLVLAPVTSGHLSLFAQGDVTLNGVRVYGGDAQRGQVSWGPARSESSLFADPTRPVYSTGSIEPLRIVAQEGSIQYGLNTEPLEAAVPVRLIAGGDIVASAALALQHQTATDLSLLQAGGSIRYIGGTAPELVRLHGPGDVVVMAGQDIDLGQGSGIVAVGNQENSLLPRGSAAVHVLAGVDPARGDYVQAAQRQFAVLAGGLAGLPEPLAEQIEAARGLPAGTSGDNLALLARARSLAGEPAYQQALLDAMRREAKAPSWTAAQAASAFEALPAVQRGILARQVAGELLAATWLATIPAAEQSSRVLALASQQAGGAQRVAALRAFVTQRTGSDPGSDAAALERFASLPVEQQILALTPVLEQVVTEAGKAAAQVQGTAKALAYAPAYQALAAVFPQAAATADVRMGSSQIASRQGSALDILTPRGGINVGELTATSNKSASQLGVVTLGGSAQQPAPIRMLVRDDIAVNQSRVFSVDQGDVLMWSSTGNLDAGRGAKTVAGAPAPVYYLDASGKVQVDVSSAFSGSGIAVLNPASTLYLFAPRGEINTGDAGIQSKGAAFIDAVRVVGPSLQVAGPAIGLPAPPSLSNAAAGLGSLGQSATSAGQAAPAAGERSDEPPRRTVALDFIAFGSEPGGDAAGAPAAGTSTAEPASPASASSAGPSPSGDPQRDKRRRD